MAEELVREVWSRFECNVVVTEARGTCSLTVARSLASYISRLAGRLGVAATELLDEVDPDLSAEENVVKILLGRGVEVPSELVESARRLTELLRRARRLREELGVHRPGTTAYLLVSRELRGVMDEVRRLRPALRERLRSLIEALPRRAPPRPPPPRPPPAAPPRPPAPPPPPTAPPRYPATGELPLEEARARIEHFIKSRVPRVYRIDWTDLRARVSYHRGVEEELRRAVEELGGRVERVVEARPPLRIMYVDFSGARAPPIPLPPEVERWVLWSKFAAILMAYGVRPEEYREDFERVLEAYEGRPFEEKQRAVEELARAIRPPPRPPVAVVPPELTERLERIERALTELRRAVAWRPRSAEELRMLIEATLMVEPGLTWRVDEDGHPFIGPDDKTLNVLASFLDPWAIAWFMHCPSCRARLPGGALSPMEFVEHLIRVEKRVPPMFQDWLRRFAAKLEEAERRGFP